MGIHSTSQKLAQLAKLAKRTSMFDDPTQQINELTAVIKQDITNMNNEIAELQMLNAAGNRQSSEHSTSVVTNLKGRLMDTTKEFKDVLTLRTDSLKVHESRHAQLEAERLRCRKLVALVPPLAAFASSTMFDLALRCAALKKQLTNETTRRSDLCRPARAIL